MGHCIRLGKVGRTAYAWVGKMGHCMRLGRQGRTAYAWVGRVGHCIRLRGVPRHRAVDDDAVPHGSLQVGMQLLAVVHGVGAGELDQHVEGAARLHTRQGARSLSRQGARSRGTHKGRRGCERLPGGCKEQWGAATGSGGL